jgi:acetylornithine deacetylase/succinyl-diaminopimelate desuccinylase-like protein
MPSGASTASSTGGEGCRRLGREAERRRPEARGDSASRVAPGDLLRRARHQAGRQRSRRRTICLYGHLDKQPEFNGWKNGFGPWTPRYENGLLYGRGGADDGYAIYASITAIQSLDSRAFRGRAASA